MICLAPTIDSDFKLGSSIQRNHEPFCLLIMFLFYFRSSHMIILIVALVVSSNCIT